MNHELAKTLTTALVQFIDRERPEGTMCCSNIECGALEEAFKSDNLDDVEAFIQKKLSRLTEFEQFMDGVVDDTIRETYSEDGFKDICKDALALAKKELARRDEVITLGNLPPYDKGFQDGKAEAMTNLERNFKCDPAKLPGWLIDELNKAYKRGQEASHEDYIKGYANGYKDAEKQYNESVAYHFPIMPTPPSGWVCDGTHCTNPHFDCINCPRKTTGGSFSTNTSSGTSTLKAEG
jgi:hypothetical protein